MKFTYTLLLIALFAVGCNRSQTEVASAAAAAADTERDPLDMTADYPGVEESDEVPDAGEAASEIADGGDDGIAEAETDEIEAEAEETEAEAEEPAVPSWADQPAARLAAAVKDIGGFGERAVVPLAHFRSGARDVVIAWPLHNSAGQLSSTVYGVCVELRADDSYANCGDTWVVTEAMALTDPLERALGTAEFEVLTEQQSGTLDDLAEQVTALGNSFVNAAAQNDTESLFESARAFAALIPVVDRTFNNAIAALLVSAAQNRRVFWHVKTEVGDQHASLTFKVRERFTDMTTFDLTATRAGSSNRWNVIDYW